MNYHDTKRHNEGPTPVPFPIRTIIIGLVVLLFAGYALIVWQKGYRERSKAIRPDSVIRNVHLNNFNR